MTDYRFLSDDKLFELLPNSIRGKDRENADLLRRFLRIISTAVDSQLEEIEGLPTIYSINDAASSYLDYIGASLGFHLPDDLTDAEKRKILISLATVWTRKGTNTSINAMLGILVGAGNYSVMNTGQHSRLFRAYASDFEDTVVAHHHWSRAPLVSDTLDTGCFLKFVEDENQDTVWELPHSWEPAELKTFLELLMKAGQVSLAHPELLDNLLSPVLPARAKIGLTAAYAWEDFMSFSPSFTATNLSSGFIQDWEMVESDSSTAPTPVATNQIIEPSEGRYARYLVNNTADSHIVIPHSYSDFILDIRFLKGGTGASQADGSLILFLTPNNYSANRFGESGYGIFFDPTDNFIKLVKVDGSGNLTTLVTGPSWSVSTWYNLKMMRQTSISGEPTPKIRWWVNNSEQTQSTDATYTTTGYIKICTGNQTGDRVGVLFFRKAWKRLYDCETASKWQDLVGSSTITANATNPYQGTNSIQISPLFGIFQIYYSHTNNQLLLGAGTENDDDLTGYRYLVIFFNNLNSNVGEEPLGIFIGTSESPVAPYPNTYEHHFSFRNSWPLPVDSNGWYRVIIDLESAPFSNKTAFTSGFGRTNSLVDTFPTYTTINNVFLQSQLLTDNVSGAFKMDNWVLVPTLEDAIRDPLV